MKAEEIIELFRQFESIANEYCSVSLNPSQTNIRVWNAGVQENSLPYWGMRNGKNLIM